MPSLRRAEFLPSTLLLHRIILVSSACSVFRFPSANLPLSMSVCVCVCVFQLTACGTDTDIHEKKRERDRQTEKVRKIREKKTYEDQYKNLWSDLKSEYWTQHIHSKTKSSTIKSLHPPATVLQGKATLSFSFSQPQHSWSFWRSRLVSWSNDIHPFLLLDCTSSVLFS